MRFHPFLYVILFTVVLWGAAIWAAVEAAPHVEAFFQGVVDRIDHAIDYEAR